MTEPKTYRTRFWLHYEWGIMIGTRIIKDIHRADNKKLEKLQNLPVTMIIDAMQGIYGFEPRIRWVAGEKRFIGTAVTVKSPNYDNLAVHCALEMITPRDVLVVSANGESSRGLLGGVMLNFLNKSGCAGIVVDGCVRDIEDMQKLKVPVYATGISPVGATKKGPGEVNVPVSCGGQVVFPGDIIIGDENGIVSFGEEYIDEIAEMVSIKLNNEHRAMKMIDEDIEGYKRRRSNRVSQWMNESGYKWLFDRSDCVE